MPNDDFSSFYSNSFWDPVQYGINNTWNSGHNTWNSGNVTNNRFALWTPDPISSRLPPERNALEEFICPLSRTIER